MKMTKMTMTMKKMTMMIMKIMKTMKKNSAMTKVVLNQITTKITKALVWELLIFLMIFNNMLISSLPAMEEMIIKRAPLLLLLVLQRRDFLLRLFLEAKTKIFFFLMKPMLSSQIQSC